MTVGVQVVTRAPEQDLVAGEIEARIMGQFERSDFGVRGSPVWDELVCCWVDWPVNVNGLDISREEMVGLRDEETVKKLEEELCGLVDDDAWEKEE